MFDRPGPARTILWQGILAAAILFGSLSAGFRIAGSSPIVWTDTFNDEWQVERCLAGSCTLEGVATSVPGQVHAVGWLEWRTLLGWLGVRITGVHELLIWINAMTAVLLFLLASRWGGVLAGAAAVWLLFEELSSLAIRQTAVYNTIPLPFLGAVLLLACAAAIDRPGYVSVGLAALVAAVLANVHLACLVCGIAPVWVALVAPRQRIRLALFACVSFATATVLIAPPCWKLNLLALLAERESMPLALPAPSLPPGVLHCLALATVGWAAAQVSRSRRAALCRHRLHAVFGLLLPFFAAFLAGAHLGLDPGVKYLAHLKAPLALAAALPLGLGVGEALARLLSMPASRIVESIACLAAAVAVATPPATVAVSSNERAPTIHDLSEIMGALMAAQHWTPADVLSGLRAAQPHATLAGVAYLSKAGPWRALEPSERKDGATLLLLPKVEFPEPPPLNWYGAPRIGPLAAMAIVAPARLDWTRFEARVDPSDKFVAADWHPSVDQPILPPANLASSLAGKDGVIEMRVPLRAGNSPHRILMPRGPDICGGTVTGGAVSIESNGRLATVLLDAESPFVQFRWDLGSPECRGRYDGLPPLVLEGDPQTIEQLAALPSIWGPR